MGGEMAKKKRKAAAKAAKTSKAKRKVAKKKTAIAKKRGTLAARKRKPVVTKAAVQAKPAEGKKAGAPPPESLSHKIGSAVGAVIDILTDAERLHHKLEPGISNEPE